MIKQRKQWKNRVMLVFLPFILLTGCKYGERYPFYLREGDYNAEFIYMDDIKYERRNVREDEEVYKYYSSSRYKWTTMTEEDGEQIGVCGKDADKKPAFKIYEVTGDEEQIFLYTEPAHFYFHGNDVRLWRQEGVLLNKPCEENTASFSLVYKEETLLELDSLAMIAEFFKVYNSDTVQGLDIGNYGDKRYCSLIMRHKDYPFLQYKIECCCSLEGGMAFCRKSGSGEWFPLPAEWCKVISEIDFPVKEE